MSFGENVRSARRRLNWTQDELAAKLSCTKTAVCKWERNKSFPALPRLKVLSEILGIEPRVLLKYDATNGERRSSLPVESAKIDPRLLQAWQKLGPEQRTMLIQIALIFSLK